MPQSDQLVAFQRVETAGRDPAPPLPPAASPRCARRCRRSNRTISAPSPTGDIRYRDRRLLVLYFDLTAMPPPTRCARTRRRASSSTRR